MFEPSLIIKYWVLFTIILWIKMLANSILQGYFRFKNKQFVTPEDAKAFGGLIKQKVDASFEEHPMVLRLAKCWRNDLENIPAFLLISLGYALLGGSAAFGLVCFIVFTVSRVLHTFFYVASKQPHRNIAFDFGLITTIVMVAGCIPLLF
jgi:uncharacterized MAPEG superfamily protein